MEEKKYPYKIYRLAFAKVLCNGFELVEDSYEWSIYKNQNQIILLKYLDYKSNDTLYNFTFKTNSNDISDENNGYSFQKLFRKTEEDTPKTIFYLIMKNNEKFTYFQLESSIYFQENKFSIDSDITFKMSVSLDHKKIKFSPYSRDNKSIDIDELTNIEITEQDLLKTVKENKQMNYPETDWNRIMLRRYDYEKKYFTPSLAKNGFLEEFKKILPLDDFKKKFFEIDKQIIERKCIYCGVHEKQLYLLDTKRVGRGNRLEYDRVESSEEDGIVNTNYQINNVELTCYWCNNAKTDTFTPKKFKEIARGINKVWNQALKEKNPQTEETICFPENSFIWDK